MEHIIVAAGGEKDRARVSARARKRVRVSACERETDTREGETERESERARESGTEFYSKNPTPIGSRPSDLTGLCRHTEKTHPPNTFQATPSHKHISAFPT